MAWLFNKKESASSKNPTDAESAAKKSGLLSSLIKGKPQPHHAKAEEAAATPSTGPLLAHNPYRTTLTLDDMPGLSPADLSAQHHEPATPSDEPLTSPESLEPPISDPPVDVNPIKTSKWSFNPDTDGFPTVQDNNSAPAEMFHPPLIHAEAEPTLAPSLPQAESPDNYGLTDPEEVIGPIPLDASRDLQSLINDNVLSFISTRKPNQAASFQIQAQMQAKAQVEQTLQNPDETLQPATTPQPEFSATSEPQQAQPTTTRISSDSTLLDTLYPPPEAPLMVAGWKTPPSGQTSPRSSSLPPEPAVQETALHESVVQTVHTPDISQPDNIAQADLSSAATYTSSLFTDAADPDDLIHTGLFELADPDPIYDPPLPEAESLTLLDTFDLSETTSNVSETSVPLMNLPISQTPADSTVFDEENIITEPTPPPFTLMDDSLLAPPSDPFTEPAMMPAASSTISDFDLLDTSGRHIGFEVDAEANINLEADITGINAPEEPQTLPSVQSTLSENMISGELDKPDGPHSNSYTQSPQLSNPADFTPHAEPDFSYIGFFDDESVPSDDIVNNIEPEPMDDTDEASDELGDLGDFDDLMGEMSDYAPETFGNADKKAPKLFLDKEPDGLQEDDLRFSLDDAPSKAVNTNDSPVAMPDVSPAWSIEALPTEFSGTDYNIDYDNPSDCHNHTQPTPPARRTEEQYPAHSKPSQVSLRPILTSHVSEANYPHVETIQSAKSLGNVGDTIIWQKSQFIKRSIDELVDRYFEQAAQE